jgi:CubicO group peptidase (beta-lactamase class C family)
MTTMKLIAIANALSALPQALAYCPPTGPVLPPPRLTSLETITTSLQNALRELSNPANPSFNTSETSFSVQVTTAESAIFEFHHTAPIRNSSGVSNVDGDSIYRVASISKLITTYALLLQDDVCTDDPITDHIPSLTGAGLERYQNITLRMLASQLGAAAREGTRMRLDCQLVLNVMGRSFV